MNKPETKAQELQQQLDDSIAIVRDALAGLRFGNVSLTVHEGRVVQIDVTQRKRLSSG